MRAGLKQRVITLQVKSSPQDASGHPVEMWTTARTLRAQKMEGPRVSERYASFQLAATVLMVFRVGYWPAYDTIRPDTHRILYEGRPLNIAGTFEISRKDGVEIVCQGRAE